MAVGKKIGYFNEDGNGEKVLNNTLVERKTESIHESQLTEKVMQYTSLSCNSNITEMNNNAPYEF